MRRATVRLATLTALAAATAILPTPTLAQETPTEREAAREVLRKMAALEQSLDVPALVTKLTGAKPARDQVVARAKELMDSELLAMGDDITRHPEIGFVETRSVKILTDWLTAHGFDVTMGVAELKTAFVARYTATTARPTSASSSSTTRCAAPRARSTATSTARRDPSASPRRWRWRST